MFHSRHFGLLGHSVAIFAVFELYHLFIHLIFNDLRIRNYDFSFF